MRLRFLFVGKLGRRELAPAARDYLERIARFLPAEMEEVPEGKRADLPGRMREEAENVRRRLGKNSRLVLLDERGKTFTSDKLAKHLGNLISGGGKELVFLVGSSHGVDVSLREEASEVISLGELTWTHDLSRVMVLEQFYRAFSILRGHPFHHA